MIAVKSLRLTIGIVLAALFSWLIFRRANLIEIRHALSDADWRWIAAAVLAFILGYCGRIQRWHLMLKRDSPSLTWRACAGPFLGSYAANNVLPFRAGDLLRSFAFNGELGTSSGVVVATLLAERLLDLLMVLALLAVALLLFNFNSPAFSGLGSIVLLGLAGAMLLILLFPRLFRPFASAAARGVSSISPRLGKKLHDEIEKSFSTLGHLTRGHTMISLLIWSVLAWLAEGCVYWFAALSLPAISKPFASWVALPVGTLSTLIPSTPGYVGTFDYFTLRAMADLGNTSAATTAYVLLVHCLLWFPPTLAGGLYLILRSRHTALVLLSPPRR